MASILGNGSARPLMMGTGGFGSRMSGPGRVGQGNTGIVPPGFEQRPVASAMPHPAPPVLSRETGGSLPPRPGLPPMGTGESVPAPSAPAPPMGSGTTQPGLPRPPGLPTNTAMSLPRVGPTGLPAQRSAPTGRPAGGLFPRLG